MTRRGMRHLGGVVRGCAFLACLAHASTWSKKGYDDALEGNPRLRKQLLGWWGDAAYNATKHEMQVDLHLAGDASCGQRLLSLEGVLEDLLRRRARAGPCAELPLSLATHAWRYEQQELSACLALAPGGTCRLSCRDLPQVSTQVSCTASGRLLGAAPAGECRHQPDPAIVETSGGALRGLVRPIAMRWADGRETVERVRTFWGVPYGEQPERFRAPRPRARWQGVRDSVDYYEESPLLCPSLPPLGKNISTSEDCLFLHMYVPPGVAPSHPRPVIVYLLGGGFMNSDNFQGGWYDAARFALRNDVVFVVLSFRIGFLGHWAHPALAEEAEDGGFGNYEALDQRLALRWLRRNLAAFGGDAERVTLLGHSSGAFAVQFHLLSPESSGLFSGAILEGAALDSGWYFTEQQDAITFYATVAQQVGCPLVHDSKEQLRCLRRLPLGAFYDFAARQSAAVMAGVHLDLWDAVELLAGTAWSALGFRGNLQPVGLNPQDLPILTTPLWPGLPVGFLVDGAPSGLPASPRVLYEAGRVNPAKIYLDHGADEGTVFAGIMLLAYPWYKNVTVSHAAVDAILSWAMGGADFARDLLAHYPAGRGENSPFYRLSRVISDNVFICPHRRFTRKVSAQRPGSVFYAETTFAGSGMQDSNWIQAALHKDLAYFLGASHMNQPQWIFGTNQTALKCRTRADQDPEGQPQNVFGMPWQASDQRMHELVDCRYGLFAHCGNPDVAEAAKCVAGAKLNSCESALKGISGALQPFLPYDQAEGRRFRLGPDSGGFLTPTREEEELCDFWDSAPASRYVTSACRGCAQKEAEVFI